METVSTFMDAIVEWTLTGICAGFCLLCVIGIWKWFFGVARRALFYLFPGLKGRAQRRDSEKDLR